MNHCWLHSQAGLCRVSSHDFMGFEKKELCTQEKAPHLLKQESLSGQAQQGGGGEERGGGGFGAAPHGVLHSKFSAASPLLQGKGKSVTHRLRGMARHLLDLLSKSLAAFKQREVLCGVIEIKPAV